MLGAVGGPVETAWVTALATPRQGHAAFVASVAPGVAVRPFTLFVNKAFIADERHGRLTWGPAHAGVAAGVMDAVAEGTVLEAEAPSLLLIAAVWVDPAAADEAGRVRQQPRRRAGRVARRGPGAAECLRRAGRPCRTVQRVLVRLSTTVGDVAPIRLDQLNLVTRDVQASRAFYARFGVAFRDEGDPLWDQHHVSGQHSDDIPVDIDIDSATFAAEVEHRLARRYRRRPRLQGRHERRGRHHGGRLAADGVPVQQAPYDAFWGARYAVVSDPDGNAVGIMSPVDPEHRSATTRSAVTDSGQDSIEVVVEIPTGSRNKYEYDHDEHVIRLDRRLFTATTYPADYGFVPNTLAGDGDPLDVLALVADPTFPGCVLRVRVLGMFSMRDEKGVDAKLITVLAHDPQWDDARDIEDVPLHLRNEIAHFFSIYKDLEPEKSTEVEGFFDRATALAELEACRTSYHAVESQ